MLEIRCGKHKHGLDDAKAFFEICTVIVDKGEGREHFPGSDNDYVRMTMSDLSSLIKWGQGVFKEHGISSVPENPGNPCMPEWPDELSLGAFHRLESKVYEIQERISRSKWTLTPESSDSERIRILERKQKSDQKSAIGCFDEIDKRLDALEASTDETKLLDRLIRRVRDRMAE